MRGCISPDPHASLAREGHAGIAACATAGLRTNRGRPASWRSPSSARTARRLNSGLGTPCPSGAECGLRCRRVHRDNTKCAIGPAQDCHSWTPSGVCTVWCGPPRQAVQPTAFCRPAPTADGISNTYRRTGRTSPRPSAKSLVLGWRCEHGLQVRLSRPALLYVLQMGRPRAPFGFLPERSVWNWRESDQERRGACSSRLRRHGTNWMKQSGRRSPMLRSPPRELDL
jgi:hypothetical protein